MYILDSIFKCFVADAYSWQYFVYAWQYFQVFRGRYVCLAVFQVFRSRYVCLAVFQVFVADVYA
jgi:hypothetical protein